MVQKQMNNRFLSEANSSSIIRRKKSASTISKVDDGQHHDLEVDYNVNPTKLFTYIDQSKWDKAIERVRKAPSEAKTWLVSKGSGMAQFRYLPLHLCLQFNPPFAVVEAILLAYNEAVTKSDHEGKLPLHHICQSSSIADKICDEKVSAAIVHLLVSLYPESIYEPDETGKDCFDIVQSVVQKEGKSSRTEAILQALQYWQIEDNTMVESRDDFAVERTSINEKNLKNDSHQIQESIKSDQTMVRLVVQELESALVRAKDDKEELKTTNGRLQKDNEELQMELRKLKRELADAVMNANVSDHEDKKIIQLYENQIEELNQDNEESRNKLIEQTAYFDSKFRSLTHAHEEALYETNLTLKRQEAQFEDERNSLKSQLSSSLERLKAYQVSEGALREKYTAQESEKEELKTSINRIHHSFKENEQIVASSFEKKVLQLEADLKDNEAEINALQKAKVMQEGELKELRSLNIELKQKEQSIKAAFERKLSQLEEDKKTIQKIKEMQEGQLREQKAFYEKRLAKLEADLTQSQGLKEKQKLIVAAFDRKQFQLEADLKSSEAKMNSLLKVKSIQEGELKEFRSSNAELKQKEQLTKAAYERKLSQLQGEMNSIQNAKETQEGHLREKQMLYEEELRRIKIANNAYHKQNAQLELELSERENVINNLQKAKECCEEACKKQILDAEEKLETTSQSFVAALQEHELKKRELSSQVTALETKMAAFEEELRLEKNAKEKRNQEYEIKRNELMIQQGVLEKKISALENELSEKNKATFSIQEKYAKLEVQQAANETKIFELEEKITVLEAQRANLKEAISKNNETFQAKVKLLNEKRQSLLVEVSSLKSFISQAEGEKRSLKELLEETKNKLQNEKKLASARNSAEVAAERKHAQVQSELREEIANLQAKNTALEDRLLFSKKLKLDENAENQKLESTVKDFLAKISSLENENEDLRQKISHFENNAANQVDLENQIKILRSDACKQKEEVQELTENANEKNIAREKVHDLEFKKTSLVEVLERNGALYKKKLEDMKDEKRKLQEENDNLKQQTKKALEKVISAETKRASLKEEVSQNYMAMLEKVKKLKESKDTLENEKKVLQNQLLEASTKAISNRERSPYDGKHK